MEGVLDYFPKEEGIGVASITHLEFEDKKDPLFNLRAIRDGGWLFYLPDGRYVRLHINGQLMMSDTPMEKESSREFIQRSHGRILIAGLGLGLVLHHILKKPNVTEVIVIEKYQDVISLVGPKFTDPRLKIICADIFDWRPMKGEKFNTIFFDIWPEISQENLDDIKKLHNSFKFYVDRTDECHWMGSWMQWYLTNQRRRERNERW